MKTPACPQPTGDRITPGQQYNRRHFAPAGIIRLRLLLICLPVIVLILTGCSGSPDRQNRPRSGNQSASIKKKVLFVNSYHRGYAWSDGITGAVLRTFNAAMDSNGGVDNSKSLVDLKIIYLDTKRHKSEAFKKKAALKARQIIESWRPDLVITADDNAAKYLIVPYYRGGKLPFVFCGVNQDASKYGFPAANVTGMVEVFLLPQAVRIIRPYAKGDRICAIAADTISEHENIESSGKQYGVDFSSVYYADTFSELKDAYLRSQNDCDMTFLFEFFSVKGFNRKKFLKIIRRNTRIPTATLYSFARDYVLASCAIVAAEQGEWAARTAIRILAGESPAAIPLATNRRARIYLNMGLAKELNIIFPMELIERATFTGKGP